MIEPKGNNITIRPKPIDKVRSSGIIIPDTVTPSSQQWGTVLIGNDLIKTGSQVLYYNLQCFTKDKGKDTEEKIVSTNKCLFWR